DADDLAPILFRHHHEYFVARHARIVDQPVDLPEFLFGRVDHLAHVLQIAYIDLVREHLHAELLDFGLELGRILIALEVVERYVGAAPCDFQSDRPANSARRAGDDDSAPVEIFHLEILHSFLHPNEAQAVSAAAIARSSAGRY